MASLKLPRSLYQVAREVCSRRTFTQPFSTSNVAAMTLDRHTHPRMDLVGKSKVELHVHLDGSVRPETIWDLASEQGIKLPVDNRLHLRDLLQIRVVDAKTLTEFLDKFNIFFPVLIGSEAAIERMAYEFCEDMADEHVIYAEARLAPHLLATDQLSPKRVVEVVLGAFEKGREDFGVKVNLILACMRHEPKWSSEVLELCRDFRSRGVAGIDLAGDENLTKMRPTEPEHIRVFQEAERLGIRRTVHAGENGPAENVRVAVEEMRAERIGHGYHSLQDMQLYRSLLDRRIHLETCPMSSFITGSVPVKYKEHPIHKFAADGANFSLNSDDPVLTGCFLHGEYQFAQDELQLSDRDLIISNLNAAKSSFLPNEERQKLLDRLETDYKKEIAYYGIDLTKWAI